MFGGFVVAEAKNSIYKKNLKMRNIYLEAAHFQVVHHQHTVEPYVDCLQSSLEPL